MATRLPAGGGGRGGGLLQNHQQVQEAGQDQLGGRGRGQWRVIRQRQSLCVCVLPGWRRPQSCTGVWITPHKEPRLCWTDAALQAAKDTNTDTHTYHHHPMPDTTLSVCVCMFLPCWARYGADSELPACSSPVCGGHWRGGRGEGGGTGEVRVLGGSPAPNTNTQVKTEHLMGQSAPTCFTEELLSVHCLHPPAKTYAARWEGRLPPVRLYPAQRCGWRMETVERK